MGFRHWKATMSFPDGSSFLTSSGDLQGNSLMGTLSPVILPPQYHLPLSSVIIFTAGCSIEVVP